MINRARIALPENALGSRNGVAVESSISATIRENLFEIYCLLFDPVIPLLLFTNFAATKLHDKRETTEGKDYYRYSDFLEVSLHDLRNGHNSK